MACVCACECFLHTLTMLPVTKWMKLEDTKKNVIRLTAPKWHIKLKIVQTVSYFFNNLSFCRVRCFVHRIHKMQLWFVKKCDLGLSFTIASRYFFGQPLQSWFGYFLYIVWMVGLYMGAVQHNKPPIIFDHTSNKFQNSGTTEHCFWGWGVVEINISKYITFENVVSFHKTRWITTIGIGWWTFCFHTVKKQRRKWVYRLMFCYMNLLYH